MTNQNDFVIDNGTGLAVRQDIQDALQALAGLSSGNSEPSVKYAYQLWADTNTGILKIRNGSNNAWVELLQLDGTLTMEDGSSSTPALAFRDDLNTGIFSSAADTFNVATGGVERMELGATTVFNEDGADVDFRIEGDTNANLFYVDAGNNRVAIGTSSPTRFFHVAGNTTDDIATFINADTTNGYGVNIQGGGSASTRYILRLAEAGGTEKFRVSSGGKVGIGSSNLTYNLEVQGTGAQTILVGSTNAAGATLILDGDSNGDGSGSDYASITHTSDGNIEINNRKAAATIFKNTSSETERMRLTGDGPHLLLGGTSDVNEITESSANAGMVIGGTGFGNGGLAIINSTSGTGRIYFGDAIGSDAARNRGQINYQHSSDSMVIATAGTPRITINSVGLVTIAGGATLDTGEFGMTSASGTPQDRFMDFGFLNHSMNMRRTNGGEAGHTNFLTVASSLTVSGDLNDTSDEKLKKNIASIADGAIAIIKQLRPVTFDWIDENRNNNVSGFIAQEIKTILPNLVYGTEYDPTLVDETKGSKGGIKSEGYSVNTVGITAHLTKALQEAIAKIETLETKVAALEAA